MAEILRHQPRKGDKIAALARPDVAEAYGLTPEDARLLYPFVLATVIVTELKEQQLPVAIVEAEGYETFATRVRGEFQESALEEFEIREAFDIIVHEGRNPGGRMHFKFADKDQMRRLAPMLNALSSGRIH